MQQHNRAILLNFWLKELRFRDGIHKFVRLRFGEGCLREDSHQEARAEQGASFRHIPGVAVRLDEPGQRLHGIFHAPDVVLAAFRFGGYLSLQPWQQGFVDEVSRRHLRSPLLIGLTHNNVLYHALKEKARASQLLRQRSHTETGNTAAEYESA